VATRSSWPFSASSTRTRSTATSCASSSTSCSAGGACCPTALKKLSKAGLIVEDVAPPAAPGTAAPVSRRQRITYRLTPAGDERFAKLMSDSGPATWEDDNFDVRFAFFGRTDQAIRLRILEGRRARLEERLSQVRADLDRSQGRDTYARELKRHGVESVERELGWLSDLIAAERGTAPPTPDASAPS
jgi:DNA-binding PadR family transcriptional regulator